MKSIWMHEHTREEISAFASGGGAILVPLAATEQHGPHLPVYTDTWIAGHIAEESVRAAGRDVPVLLAPVLPIGCSEHHLSFGGTISLSPMTYFAVLRDIGESLVKDGFRKIIFLNGHGGNEPMMQQVANDLAVRHPIWTAAASYWSLARESLQRIDASEVGPVPGHAGGFETSAIMALGDGLVRTDRIGATHPERDWIFAGPPGAFVGRHGELTGCDGYTDAPVRATAEKGRLYLDTIAEAVSGWIVRTVQAMDRGEERL
ncbi:creatininase family protein [Paenibacillus ginsengarvi]|uniref:Creatininase family protein n=1 Tax=Paenibacillus ginsengarvi TaxID=400777 RepID=A0A3B0B281_9BACL|nr:creatininase family protein [Paenibacillus ginsengarvi]RKN66088.1 creatininase family protein [Paenibacillus ginsengarvi]